MNSTLKNSLLTTLAVGLALPGAALARSWNDPTNPRKMSINDPRGFDTSFRGDPGWHPATNWTYKLFELHPSDGSSDVIKNQGSVDNQNLPWGDTYWPSQRGGMAYRWKEFQREDFDQNISGDSPEHVEQRRKLFFDIKRYPRSELLALKRSNPAEYKRVMSSLAPLEKWVLYTSKPGDEHYYNNKILNEFTKSSQAEREYWEGYCHAWSAVSSHYGEPMPVTKVTQDGLEIPFHSGDVKALLVANYQQKTSDVLGEKIGRFLDKSKKAQVRFVGKRCGSVFMYPIVKKRKGVEMFADYGDTEGLTDETYLKEYLPKYVQEAKRLNYSFLDDGAERQPDFIQKVKEKMDGCENTNAGSFHLVMVNQLGRNKEGFMFDKTRDAEVWNQPAYKYETELTPHLDAAGRPVTALSTSAPGTTSVVHVKTKLYYADDSDYGWTYSVPGNLMLFKLEGSFQQMIQAFKDEYAKYSRILMSEGDESEPLKYPLGLHDVAHYEYTLDINADGKIIGGDWISFDRPDYTWIMKKEPFFDDYARLGEIYQPVQYPAGQSPDFNGL